MPGRTVDDYDAPLFLAWQLTNGCGARCPACREESGRGTA
jgi:MoaA/NifB/PqqE/SkfB family radical SAM enzyme